MSAARDAAEVVAQASLLQVVKLATDLEVIPSFVEDLDPHAFLRGRRSLTSANRGTPLHLSLRAALIALQQGLAGQGVVITTTGNFLQLSYQVGFGFTAPLPTMQRRNVKSPVVCRSTYARESRVAYTSLPSRSQTDRVISSCTTSST